MRSRPALRLVLVASLSLGGEGPALALALSAAPEVHIRTGQADGFTHIVFEGAAPRSVRREGDDLVLRFAAVDAPDVADLRAAPPRYVTGAALASVGGGTELRLKLQPGAQAKVGRADGVVYVNVSAPPVAAAARIDGGSGARPADRAPGERPDPTPPGGVVRLRAELQGERLLLHFPWRAPLGAAAFRRGGAIWLVFDAHAAIDLTDAPHGLAQATRIVEVAGDHATALRITAPSGVLPELTSDGATWTLALARRVATPPAPVEIKPDLESTPVALAVRMAGATGVFWLDDPAVGDRIAVVTALGPPKGVQGERELVDATLLASAQGLALVPHAADLTVSADTDVVRIARPSGLSLSSPAAASAASASASASLPQPAAMPGLVEFDAWSRTAPGGFLARYDALMTAAADEAGQGRGARVQARLGLARFLVGSELSFEAVGVLDLLAKDAPRLLQDGEFRGLRGAARAMAGRYRDAAADFSAPIVAEDPASALWRGYVSAKLGDDPGARQSFAAGRSALSLFAPKWRARFARAGAEAALASGDVGGARAALAAIPTQGLDPIEAQAVALDQARVMEAQGQAGPALALYQQVSTSSYGALAAPALMHATELQLAAGQIKPQAATAALDALRYRWRGDGTELEVARALGRIYLSQGRYREALESLRGGGLNLTDAPAAAAIQADLAGAFRSLFLDGGADGLAPIQAVGLFLDFKDLTPVGADGDLMVRKLARRLVDVDLLDEAATLLKYQADNRLDGAPRAEVDTDLAMIDLMAKKPEDALDAINGSRSTLLPHDLAERRRVLQARALAALGRYDDASELLDADPSADALDARAEITWKGRQWAKAGALLEGQLGDRWRSDLVLGGQDQARLLRAAVAYSLAGDDAALGRLRARYGKLAQTAPAADALKVALAGLGDGGYSASDYMRAVSDTDAFQGWVSAMKARYLNVATAPGSPPATHG